MYAADPRCRPSCHGAARGEGDCWTAHRRPGRRCARETVTGDPPVGHEDVDDVSRSTTLSPALHARVSTSSSLFFRLLLLLLFFLHPLPTTSSSLSSPSRPYEGPRALLRARRARDAYVVVTAVYMHTPAPVLLPASRRRTTVFPPSRLSRRVAESVGRVKAAGNPEESGRRRGTRTRRRGGGRTGASDGQKSQERRGGGDEE